MVANAWEFYNTFRERMGDGTIDLDDDAFSMGLSTSAYTFNAETQANLADITNELSGSGYARDALAVTWVRATSTVTFDSDDGAFTASGGSLTARRAWIFDDTPTSPADPMVASSLLDNAPADVTVSDGNTLTVQINASGVFSLADA